MAPLERHKSAEKMMEKAAFSLTYLHTIDLELFTHASVKWRKGYKLFALYAS